MRQILLLSSFFIATILTVATSLAGTQALFSKDGSKATVLMLAMSQNPDAIAFNEVMNFPAEDISGKATKKFSFVNSSSNNTLDAVCAFSKLVGNTGSCTVIFHAVGNVSFNGSDGTITYHLSGDEAAQMAAFFVLPPVTGEVFRSTDNRFLLSVELIDGAVTSFTLRYGSNL